MHRGERSPDQHTSTLASQAMAFTFLMPWQQSFQGSNANDTVLTFSSNQEIDFGEGDNATDTIPAFADQVVESFAPMDGMSSFGLSLDSTSEFGASTAVSGSVIDPGGSSSHRTSPVARSHARTRMLVSIPPVMTPCAMDWEAVDSEAFRVHMPRRRKTL